MADRRDNTPATPVGEIQPTPAPDLTEIVDIEAFISEILTEPDTGLFTSSTNDEHVGDSSAEHVTADIPVTLPEAGLREVEDVTAETRMTPGLEHVTPTSLSAEASLCTSPSWQTVHIGQPASGVLLTEQDVLSFDPSISDVSPYASAVLGDTSQATHSSDMQHLLAIPSTDLETAAEQQPQQHQQQQQQAVLLTSAAVCITTQATATVGIPQTLASSATAHSQTEPLLECRARVTLTSEPADTLIQMEEAGLLPRGASTGVRREAAPRQRGRRTTSTVTRPSSGSEEHAYTKTDPGSQSEMTSEFGAGVPISVLLPTTQEDVLQQLSSGTTSSTERQEGLRRAFVTSLPVGRRSPSSVALASLTEAASLSSSSLVSRRQSSTSQRSSFIRGMRDVIVRYAVSHAPSTSGRTPPSETVSHPRQHPPSPQVHSTAGLRRPSPPTRFVFPPIPHLSGLSPHLSPAPTTSPPSSATSPATGDDTPGQGRAPSSTSYVIERLHETLRRRRGSIAVEEPQEKSPKTSTLTPEEIAKKERRRAQNRRAAQRCREKKKQEADHVTMAFKKLQSDNTELRHEIRKLQSEKQKLSNVLQSHLVTCQKGDNPDVIIPPTSSSSSSPPLPPPPSASSASSQMADVVVMETSTEEYSEESSDPVDEE